MTPVRVGAPLYLFEVTAGHAAGVGKHVRDHDDTPFVQNAVGRWRGRRVRAFCHDSHATVHAADVLFADLMLERSRDQNVDCLLEPRGPWQYLAAECGGFRRIDAAVLVGDARKNDDVESTFLPKGVPARGSLVSGRNRAD